MTSARWKSSCLAMQRLPKFLTMALMHVGVVLKLVLCWHGLECDSIVEGGHARNQCLLITKKAVLQLLTATVQGVCYDLDPCLTLSLANSYLYAWAFKAFEARCCSRKGPSIGSSCSVTTEAHDGKWMAC
eukprot:2201796-Amphidinium_carterae.1